MESCCSFVLCATVISGNESLFSIARPNKSSIHVNVIIQSVFSKVDSLLLPPMSQKVMTYVGSPGRFHTRKSRGGGGSEHVQGSPSTISCLQNECVPRDVSSPSVILKLLEAMRQNSRNSKESKKKKKAPRRRWAWLGVHQRRQRLAQ